MPVLLSRSLLAFSLDSKVIRERRFSLCANTIRILSDEPIPEAEISKRTGCSDETSGIGWQLRPYIIVETDPARGRGKFVRLSDAGFQAQHKYQSLARQIEERWLKRFRGAAGDVCELLTVLLKRSELAEG